MAPHTLAQVLDPLDRTEANQKRHKIHVSRFRIRQRTPNGLVQSGLDEFERAACRGDKETEFVATCKASVPCIIATRMVRARTDDHRTCPNNRGQCKQRNQRPEDRLDTIPVEVEFELTRIAPVMDSHVRERKEVLEVIGGDLRSPQQARIAGGRNLYHFVLDPPNDNMEETTYLHSFITLERYNMLAFIRRAVMLYGSNTPKSQRTLDWFADRFTDMYGDTMDGEPDGRRVHRADILSALATHALWLRKRVSVGNAALVTRDIWNEWCDTTIPRIRAEQRRMRRHEQGSGVYGYLKLPARHPKRRLNQTWILENPGSPTNEPNGLDEPDPMDVDDQDGARTPPPVPARERRAPSPEGGMPLPAQPRVQAGVEDDSDSDSDDSYFDDPDDNVPVGRTGWAAPHNVVERDLRDRYPWLFKPAELTPAYRWHCTFFECAHSIDLIRDPVLRFDEGDVALVPPTWGEQDNNYASFLRKLRQYVGEHWQRHLLQLEGERTAYIWRTVLRHMYQPFTESN